MSVDVGTAVGYLELDTSKFSGGFKSAMADMKTFQDKTLTTDQRLTGLSKGMTSVGSSLTKYVTLPLVGAGAAALKFSGEFDAEMSKVKAVANATGPEFDALREKALELGASTAFSASEVANGMTEMAKAGWSSQQILDGMSGVLDAAAASGENLSTVSTIVADAITSFGLSAKDSTRVADLLAQAANAGTIDIVDLGETFKYCAPLAKSLGFSIEDTTTAIAAMSTAGIKGSSAGTALRQAFTNLTGVIELSGDSFGKWVIETQNTDGTMRDLNSIIYDLREAFSHMTQAEKTANAEAISGKVGMSGLLSIVTMSQEEWDKLSDTMYNSAGVADQTARTMQDNLPMALEQMGGAFETLAIRIGDIMTPAFQSVVEGITNIVEKLGALDPQILTVITVIGTVVAALGPLLLIGGKLLGGFLQLKTLMSGAGLAMSALTGPIGIVIAAVAALALAWTTNFGGMRDTISNIMGTIKDTIVTFLNVIKNIWNNDLFNIKSGVTLAFKQIETTISGVLGVIEGLVQVFSGIVTLDWEKTWNGVKKIFSSIWNTIVKLFKNFLNAIVDKLIEIGANLFVAAKKAFQRIKDGFHEKWEAIKAWFKEAKEDPVKALKELPGKLFKSGKNSFESLWKGFKSVWTKIKNWFKSVGDWIKSKLQFWKDSVAEAEDTGGSTGGGGGKKKNKAKGYAKGLEYVPYDGFPAILHKGERVLTKTEADSYNKGGQGATYQFTFNSPQELSPSEQRRQFKKTMNELLFSM